MSNSRIAARLEALAVDLESERISIAAFARDFLGHIEAMDRVSYSDLKQAQLARTQLEMAIANGQAELVDVPALLGWLRDLLSSIGAAMFCATSRLFGFFKQTRAVHVMGCAAILAGLFGLAVDARCMCKNVSIAWIDIESDKLCQAEKINSLPVQVDGRQRGAQQMCRVRCCVKVALSKRPFCHPIDFPKMDTTLPHTKAVFSLPIPRVFAKRMISLQVTGLVPRTSSSCRPALHPDAGYVDERAARICEDNRGTYEKS